MADNIENLVLEMLRALRNEFKSHSVKMDEQFESVRLRLSSVESHLVSLQREVVDLHADVALSTAAWTNSRLALTASNTDLICAMRLFSQVARSAG
ncbi:MAG: hypothetical protein KDJ54_14640 [Candidatus Competibacteraceae bacterium]|nr:hypothetical protein [Candidatus Competibacteraceae bacterium]